MISQIAYTNSKCSDIWKMFIKENQKHTNIPLYLISDKLSEINQQYGYKKGDQIIRNLAMRLTDLTRESDNVARLSGSEFGLILNLIGIKNMFMTDFAKKDLLNAIELINFEIQEKHTIL